MVKWKKPKVSIVMSVYKTQHFFLKEAIESMLNQTFRDFEYIIILDGPDEFLQSIIKSYNDPRIRVIQNKKNIGLTKSLNIGIKCSKGKYIARMDADDVSYRDRLEVQYEIMEENQNIAILGSYAKNIGKRGLVRHYYSRDLETLKVRMMFYNAGIIHPTAFIRKSFLTKHEILYNENLVKCQDYGMWVDCLKYGEILEVPRVLVGYRRHADQITSKENSEIEIGYYTNLTRVKQWEDLGVKFSEKENLLLKSISTSSVNYSINDYHQLFNKLENVLRRQRKLSKVVIECELTRLWLHIALKRLKCNKNAISMLVHKKMLRIWKPSVLFYIMKYYLWESFFPNFKFFLKSSILK